MNYKWAAAILLGLIILAIAVMLQPAQPAPQGTENTTTAGTAVPLELGFAEDYGYAVIAYNGSGTATLLSLSEKPKSSILVLNRDYLGTERYSYFLDLLRPLEKEGFKITEIDSLSEAPAQENWSIIIIPSGAMPSYALPLLDSLSGQNRIIYIGRKDLVYSEKLVGMDWFSNLSNSTRPRITVVEKSLDEFYSEKNYSLIDDIRTNSWAVRNRSVFQYSGEGRSTVFVARSNGTWLRMLPAYDSGPMPQPRARIAGSSDIFPWEKATMTVELNFSTGVSQLVAEKDGTRISSSELDRVRGDEAFVIPLSFNSSGDYIIKVIDQSGVLGARRVHVKDLNISLSRAYGNSYEFLVILDGAPLADADAVVGIEGSQNTVAEKVSNGRLRVLAELPQGRSVFVISIFGQETRVSYSNSQDDILGFYLKYLGVGILLVGIFYVLIRLGKRPVYRILVPDSVPGANPELSLSSKNVVDAMLESERRFGWKGVPLHAREVGIGLRKYLGGMDVSEGNVEAIMKRLEDKGLVKSHLGMYGLSAWGDPKHNALRRIVRDKLVQNGISFSESARGFTAGRRKLVFSLPDAARDSVVIFEDEAEKKKYLSSLHGKE
ncbi:MAG: hypothetical protein WC488_01235, partial [Candidatus Micrarchaeia archaeon]